MAIRLIAFDVDGSLTDGRIFLFEDGETVKVFSARDGLGLSRAAKMGYLVGVITGRSSSVVAMRAKELGMTFSLLGVSDKVAAMEGLLEKYGLLWEEAAYFGDDWNDLALMQRVGFSGTPADATEENRKEADFVSEKKGGEGAAREFLSYIWKQEQRYEEALGYFVKNREIEQ